MKPVIQALLLADHVYVDAITGKKVVAGIFHRIQFQRQTEQQRPETPGMIKINAGGQFAGSPFAYISLTEIHTGGQELSLRYVDLSDDSAIFETKFMVPSEDPVKTVEMIIPLPMLPSTKAGNFALELLWNNEPLGYHRIAVEEIANTG